VQLRDGLMKTIEYFEQLLGSPSKTDRLPKAEANGGEFPASAVADVSKAIFGRYEGRDDRRRHKIFGGISGLGRSIAVLLTNTESH
jgi:hypothetical protein